MHLSSLITSSAMHMPFQSETRQPIPQQELCLTISSCIMASLPGCIGTRLRILIQGYRHLCKVAGIKKSRTVFDMHQVDSRGLVKTLHHNKPLPFNGIPVEKLLNEQKKTKTANGSNTEPRAPVLVESESSSQSSSESSSEDD